MLCFFSGIGKVRSNGPILFKSSQNVFKGKHSTLNSIFIENSFIYVQCRKIRSCTGHDFFFFEKWVNNHEVQRCLSGYPKSLQHFLFLNLHLGFMIQLSLSDHSVGPHYRYTIMHAKDRWTSVDQPGGCGGPGGCGWGGWSIHGKSSFAWVRDEEVGSSTTKKYPRFPNG